SPPAHPSSAHPAFRRPPRLPLPWRRQPSQDQKSSQADDHEAAVPVRPITPNESSHPRFTQVTKYGYPTSTARRGSGLVWHTADHRSDSAGRSGQTPRSTAQASARRMVLAAFHPVSTAVSV